MPQRSSTEIRASIEEQRTLLAGELEQLRTGIAEVTDWRKQLREHKREAVIAAAVIGGGTFGSTYFAPAPATPPVLMGDGNTAAPLSSAERYPNLSEGNAPSTTPCGTDQVSASPDGPGLADIIRKSALTGTVAGLPTPSDPAYGGLTYKGDQASVAGDITVNPIDVDVLLGDQPIGT